jgi:hypothetical protein
LVAPSHAKIKDQTFLVSWPKGRTKSFLLHFEDMMVLHLRAGLYLEGTKRGARIVVPLGSLLLEIV